MLLIIVGSSQLPYLREQCGDGFYDVGAYMKDDGN